MSRFSLRALLGATAFLVSIAGPLTAAHAQTPPQMEKKPVFPPKPFRLRDGHLNLTGFWIPVHGLLDMNFGLGGSPPMKPGMPPPPPPPFSQFPPLKSPYKEALGKFMQSLMAGKVTDPVALCYPPGMPRMMAMPYGMEVLQVPGEVAISSEWQAADRRVWLNAKHPGPDDLDPSYAGDSVGHWEGDTLVVDTVGVRDDVPLNYTGLTHSDKLHIIEKFTEKTPGILVDQITILDPDVFVAPWVDTETYRYRPDLRIEEYVCLENNRNVGAEGEATFNK